MVSAVRIRTGATTFADLAHPGPQRRPDREHVGYELVVSGTAAVLLAGVTMVGLATGRS